MGKSSKEQKKLPGIEIVCLGGDGGRVTGSCHRVNYGTSSMLIDCGMFQGREERSKSGIRYNFDPIGNIAKGVSDVLLTHVHIDHTGRLPMIYRAGFSPEIKTTGITAAFLKAMLKNSAEIQGREHPDNRLYEKLDVVKTLRYLVTVDPYTKVPIGQKHSGITAEFLPNGHVMGANSIFVRINEQNILFTGDIGKPYQSLCGGHLDQVGPYPDDPVHTIVLESTNFERSPKSFEEKKANLLDAIKNTWSRGGNPLLPTLSFHRLQEIIEMLYHCQKDGSIPSDCQIFIDAPLGMSLLDIFKELGPDQLSSRYGDDADYYQTPEASMTRFDLRNLTVINSNQDSILNAKRLAHYPGKVIVIASGGMGEHGRMVNYRREFCGNPKNSVIFTCHQVEGTKGAALVHSKNVPVGNSKGAMVEKVDGFTSHASGDEIRDYLKRYNLGSLRTVIIAHGNESARVAMAEKFRRTDFGQYLILPASLRNSPNLVLSFFRW